MKIGIVSPTTWQLVEKMAVLFPEGIEVVGPLADDEHYWNNYHRKIQEWKDLHLNVSLNIQKYQYVDFSAYDLLIHSAETFGYSSDWKNYCHRIECPILLKACWTKYPALAMPNSYIELTRQYPVLLEMPAHLEMWRREGYDDVNLIFNPVGDWWLKQDWTGNLEQVLFVLSGSKSWRGDLSHHGFEIWRKIVDIFPSNTYHHDGHESYITSIKMAELFRDSRVFINLDCPYGQGERPITLAFTEALSAGLPVIARRLPGLSYINYIDSNGVCTDNLQVMINFIDLCLSDKEYARKCSIRSREIACKNFSYSALRPKYGEIIERAKKVFDLHKQKRIASFNRKTHHSISKKSPFVILKKLYQETAPSNFDIFQNVLDFYSNTDYWKLFKEWEQSPDSYSIRDKQFVESIIITFDGLSIVNVGCFYPWAELEWGKYASYWMAIDINPSVIENARNIFNEVSEYNVFFMKTDVTKPVYCDRRFDYTIDLSTFDQLDPQRYEDVLCNYTRFSNRLILAYDATTTFPAIYDFKNYGFNAALNPKIVEDMLTWFGFKILVHKPFSYHNRSYIFASLK